MSDESTQAPLRIRYTDPDGNQTEKILGDKPITVGRSPDADVITLDERASRMHCSIRLWDGEYYVKDLKSKNGTYLNQKRVEMAKIKPGDKIRLGNSILVVDDKKAPGTDTTISSVQSEMDGGKGYKTILREIVQNTEGKSSESSSEASEASETASEPVIEKSSPEERKSKTAKLAEESDGEKPRPVTLKKPSGSGSKVIRINRPGKS
jgi:pSer/pThr/pTyr-binding forkhead associated (FHA) protein